VDFVNRPLRVNVVEPIDKGPAERANVPVIVRLAPRLIPATRIMVRLFKPLVTEGSVVAEVYSPKVTFDDDPPVRLPETTLISLFRVNVFPAPIENAPLFK